VAALSLCSFAIVNWQGAEASTSAPLCSQSELRVTYSGILAGTGNFNMFFVVKNVSSKNCSLRGFPQTSFKGAENVQLRVPYVDSADSDGNDLGGLRPGEAIPTVVLAAGHGVASFSIYGRDEPRTNSLKGCEEWRRMLVELPDVKSTETVYRLAQNEMSYLWCGSIVVHPVVPGRSGTDPPGEALPLATASTTRFVPTTRNGCQAEELAIAPGNGNGAAGTAFSPIIFTNDSTNTCWLKGYPEVTLSNSAKSVDKDSVHMRTGIYANPKPRLIVLRPSQVASIGISYTDEQIKSDVCREFKTVNVAWRADDLLWQVHLSDMNFPCGSRFAVTAFERGALPEQS
jgi:Protein of unknown function (DUF4232)